MTYFSSSLRTMPRQVAPAGGQSREVPAVSATLEEVGRRPLLYKHDLAEEVAPEDLAEVPPLV